MVVVVVASEAAAVGCRAAATAAVAAVAAVRLPPCPTQSSCRWQCHCNANIGIETFFSTEATDSLSLYPPKSSGTYRDGGIFTIPNVCRKVPFVKTNVLNFTLHQHFAPFLWLQWWLWSYWSQPYLILFRQAFPPSIALAQYYPLAFFHLIRASKVELRLWARPLAWKAKFSPALFSTHPWDGEIALSFIQPFWQKGSFSSLLFPSTSENFLTYRRSIVQYFCGNFDLMNDGKIAFPSVHWTSASIFLSHFHTIIRYGFMKILTWCFSFNQLSDSSAVSLLWLAE